MEPVQSVADVLHFAVFDCLCVKSCCCRIVADDTAHILCVMLL